MHECLSVWTLSGKCALVEIDSLTTEEWRCQFPSRCPPNFLICSVSVSLSYAAVLSPSRPPLHPAPCCEGRFQVLANNNLQIHQVTKADEGVYRCEASVEARGEIDFVDIAVVVNGELVFD